jgi:hypothetical protein
MNSTKYPATVRELGDMAEELGMKASELLEMLGPIPMPPAGYTLAPKSSDRWIGTEIINRRWILTPVWHSTTDSHSVDVWMADHMPPNYAELTPAEATELAAALLHVTKAARAEDRQG